MLITSKREVIRGGSQEREREKTHTRKRHRRTRARLHAHLVLVLVLSAACLVYFESSQVIKFLLPTKHKNTK
jgi:hypothetical protein